MLPICGEGSCNEPPIVNRSGDVLVQGLSGGKEVGRRDVAQRAVLAVLVVEADEVSDADPGPSLNGVFAGSARGKE